MTLGTGPQGGQHVWIQVRARGIEPTQPQLRIRVYRSADGALIGASNFSGRDWAPVHGAEDTYASEALTAAVDNRAYCALLRGETAVVVASVDDRAGHCGTQQVTVRVDGWSDSVSAQDRAAWDGCCADPSSERCYPDGPPDAG